MKKNVVVFCLDTVRKDCFDEYATCLKSRSDISFDRWHASSSWTVASHGTMFSGNLPHESGINVTNWDIGSLSIDDTFVSDLRDFKTIAGSANEFLTPSYGADRLVDEFIVSSPYRRFADGMDIAEFSRKHEHVDSLPRAFLRSAVTHDSPVKSLLNGVSVKIRNVLRDAPVPTVFDDGARMLCKKLARALSQTDEPAFVYVNLMEAHGPHSPSIFYDGGLYSGPSGWSSAKLPDQAFLPRENVNPDDLHRFRELYTSALDYLDRIVSDTIDEMRSVLEGDTTFVITADHGENLGYEADNYRVGHESSLSEGVLHVPMEIINPPNDPPDISSLYSHRDFSELVSGLARNEWQIKPRDVVVAERIGTAMGRKGVAGSEDGTEIDRTIRAGITGREKYVWDSTGRQEKFQLDDQDPSYQQFIAGEATIPEQICAEFETDIGAVRSEGNEDDGDDPPEKSLKRLEDLGYL